MLRWAIRQLGGDGFDNPAYRTRLLLRHLWLQRVLRINAHVPWPVHPSSTIKHPRRIDPGSRAPGLSPGCYLQGRNGIYFGRDVWVGPGVGIISANHDLHDYSQHVDAPPVRIGDHCWLGMNAVILPGVQLAERVVVGAGAIVTRNAGPNVLIAGNPARVVRALSDDEPSTTPA